MSSVLMVSDLTLLAMVLRFSKRVNRSGYCIKQEINRCN